MRARLLKKEFRLCLHPNTPLMILLAALVIVPNYPYGVSFFFLTLGFFFISLGGRENHDVTFSMTLPVSRKDIVVARVSFFVILEMIQLVLVGLFTLLHKVLLHDAANAAGMDAGVVLIGNGFLYYTLFHLLFFPSYYKNVDKVGVSFVKSASAMFVLVILEIVATYAVPFVRDVLDTTDPAHMSEKLIYVAVCAVVYVLGLLLAVRISQRRFEKQDIR